MAILPLTTRKSMPWKCRGGFGKSLKKHMVQVQTDHNLSGKTLICLNLDYQMKHSPDNIQTKQGNNLKTNQETKHNRNKRRQM